ncbi:MAG: hypothetical protein ABSF95_04710 [Verrucomicrobiota bacterium]|jgi:hypothetical protein
MNQGFLPLSLSAHAASPAAGSQTNLAAAPQGTRPFRPLATAAAAAQPAPPCGGEPKLSLEREGGRITRIKIQCCCGHVIELACGY